MNHKGFGFLFFYLYFCQGFYLFHIGVTHDPSRSGRKWMNKYFIVTNRTHHLLLNFLEQCNTIFLASLWSFIAFIGMVLIVAVVFLYKVLLWMKKALANTPTESLRCECREELSPAGNRTLIAFIIICQRLNLFDLMLLQHHFASALILLCYCGSLYCKCKHMLTWFSPSPFMSHTKLH